MKFLHIKPVSISLVALAVALSTGTPQANAQGLFDRLFGGGVKRTQPTDFPPPPPKASKPKSVAPARISAPSYYTYKAESLAKVDFSALKVATQSASLEPSLSGTAFREAIPGLAEFELFAEKDIAKALVDYYSANPDFIWISEQIPNERTRQAVRMLSEAEGYGLVSSDYSVPVPPVAAPGADHAARLRELIRFEMALSARVLRYVRDAHGGRVDPNKLSGYHDFAPKPVDLASALKSLSQTGDVHAFLEEQHPQNPEYRALRVELETLRASEENEIVVDAKLLLKPGETSAELPKLLHLIARDLDDELGGDYGEMLSRLSNSETYVQELVPLMKAIQIREGLKPDGVVGPRTVAMLAGTSKADRLNRVNVALEQLRWLPSELGSTRVFINQPAFTASYIEDNQEKLNTRTVIGSKANQTTFFYDEIEQVDYNPYWGVPQSIIVNEMLPRLRNDPGYLDRAGYEVTDSNGRRVPSAAVNWGQYGSKVPYSVRQAPSEANALGELKILFPNKHAIYMHDTPQKALFDRDSRAFSHGCVRLADPRGMAAAVLGKSVDYVAGKLEQGHSMEKVDRKIPVYVAYFTAWPTLDGKVEYFDDVYDRDTRVKAAMDRTGEVRTPSS